MKASDFDYDLPEDLIAQVPLEDRAASRLLHLERQTGSTHHRQFRDVLELLESGDLLVMNNTRVSAIRLFGEKPTGGQAETLLLREESDGCFRAIVKPAKRLRIGAQIEFPGDLQGTVTAEHEGGQRSIQFETQEGWREALAAHGRVPLPPYIHTVMHDGTRYNTVIASTPGSAAAPTAGLHFTEEILDQLGKKGVKLAQVTLDVGLDTFRPLQVDDLIDHIMHGERCEVSQATADAVAACSGRIIAVGTTSVRTLETFAVGRRSLRTGSEESRLFITPGYHWQIIDGMFTNFHMPRTTMMAMISALATRDSVMAAYQEAVNLRYRFLSFGDSMLIL